MPKGILYVETRPSSPELEAEFQEWYDEIHLAEVVALPGIVAARRYVAVRDDGGPFVAIYDLEADDLREVIREIRRAMQENRMRVPACVQMDPPPTMRLLQLTTSYGPGPAPE
jgi:hypothetical protein